MARLEEETKALGSGRERETASGAVTASRSQPRASAAGSGHAPDFRRHVLRRHTARQSVGLHQSGDAVLPALGIAWRPGGGSLGCRRLKHSC